MRLQFSRKKIEDFLQKNLSYYFFLVFSTTAAASFYGYLQHHPWKMGDWLINYQGGFVRRGFLGEVIFQLAQLTHVNPGLYVVIFQIFFYAVFFYFSYVLLKKQDVLLPFAFLIFSPFIFTFQINDLQGGFRKEIIFFALLAFITWAKTTKNQKNFEKIFYISLVFYPLIIFTHEMLIIFLPYLLVVYFLSVKIDRKNVFLISILLVPSIISFFVAFSFHGTENQNIKIFHSLAEQNYSVSGGAISWLSKGVNFGLSEVVRRVIDDYYIGYFFVFLTAICAYFPLYNKLKEIIKNRLSFILIFVCWFGSFGLFFVAVDWGRFIYIHLVSLFFILLLPTLWNQEYKIDAQKMISKTIFILFILYSLFWHVPHCSSPLKGYGGFNIKNFKTPYKKILSYYSADSKRNDKYLWKK